MWESGLSVWCACTWYGSWQGGTVAAIHPLVFILLSGFCLPLAATRSTRRGGVWVRRTCHGGHADLHACGCSWFGVLTLLGSAMIITGLLEK